MRMQQQLTDEQAWNARTAVVMVVGSVHVQVDVDVDVVFVFGVVFVPLVSCFLL